MSFDPKAEGWKPFDAYGITEVLGPFWSKRSDVGWRYGFLAEHKHTNRMGIVHGGMLMTFIDHALGMMVWEAAGRQPCVTLQLDTQFIAAAKPGDFVEAHGHVTRVTRSVVFMRGTLSAGDNELIAANGIWKRLTTANC